MLVPASTPDARPCRVLIAGHPAVCEALKIGLAPVPTIDVVGCCPDAHEALERTRSLRPDAVLIDAAYFDKRGETLMWRLLRCGSGARIVALADASTALPAGVIRVEKEGQLSRIFRAVTDEACDHTAEPAAPSEAGSA